MGTVALRRLFICADPPPYAVEHLGHVVDGLAVSRANAPGRSTRVAARDRWHITLVFLGDVPAERLDDAAAALDAGVARGGPPGHHGSAAGPVNREAPGMHTNRGAGAGVDATRGGPLVVRFAGGGTFGRGGFTILWAGIGGDVAGLRDLAAAVRRQVRAARLPADAKAFRPHLTIARPGNRVEPELLAQDVSTLEAYIGPEWTVTELHLVESQLGPDPVHTTHHRTQLVG